MLRLPEEDDGFVAVVHYTVPNQPGPACCSSEDRHAGMVFYVPNGTQIDPEELAYELSYSDPATVSEDNGLIGLARMQLGHEGNYDTRDMNGPGTGVFREWDYVPDLPDIVSNKPVDVYHFPYRN